MAETSLPLNPGNLAAHVAAQEDSNTWRDNYEFFRKLGVYIWPYRKRFLVGELAGVAFAVFNGILPLLLKVVFDHASPSHMTKARHGQDVLVRWA